MNVFEKKCLRSKWRTGTRRTEVRLDEWCEGGLGQQGSDDGG